MEKTNAMRLLDAARIEYESHGEPCDVAVSGTELAQRLHLPVDNVFKTLVTIGASKRNYVFVIPVSAELSLKKAAKAVGEKSIEMIKSRELLPLTGYVHGGCSPIGMKKALPTILDEQALICDTIYFSAGRIGMQLEMPPEQLKRIIDYTVCDVTV